MFVAALRKLAEHCEFGAGLNDTLRGRLVCGLRDDAAQRKLLTVSDLTLEQAISIIVFPWKWHHGRLNSYMHLAKCTQ